MTLNSIPDDDSALSLRRPTKHDGARIWEIARDSKVLDLNSPYCYLVLCEHFAETCVVAELEGDVVGFVVGYHPPGHDDTVFVWQIAVDQVARGRGVASKLLDYFAGVGSDQPARFLETTITPDNEPSQRLFLRWAEKQGADVAENIMFAAADFPGSATHKPEHLYRIGPLGT